MWIAGNGNPRFFKETACTKNQSEPKAHKFYFQMINEAIQHLTSPRQRE
jgi:hypothetical protein